MNKIAIILSCFCFLLICSMSSVLAFDDYGDDIPYDQQLALNKARTIPANAGIKNQSMEKVYPEWYEMLRDSALISLNSRNLHDLYDILIQMEEYSWILYGENIDDKYLLMNPGSLNYWRFDIIWFGLKAIEMGLIEEAVQRSSKLDDFAEARFAMHFIKNIEKLNNYVKWSGIKDRLNKNTDSLLNSAYDSFEPGAENN
jgi:hypothetical protein